LLAACWGFFYAIFIRLATPVYEKYNAARRDACASRAVFSFGASHGLLFLFS
jgi:hypothetical protein